MTGLTKRRIPKPKPPKPEYNFPPPRMVIDKTEFLPVAREKLKTGDEYAMPLPDLTTGRKSWLHCRLVGFEIDKKLAMEFALVYYKTSGLPENTLFRVHPDRLHKLKRGEITFIDELDTSIEVRDNDFDLLF